MRWQAPGYRMMDTVGRAGITMSSLRGVLMTPPLFNTHTDYTATFEPGTGRYTSTAWLDAVQVEG